MSAAEVEVVIPHHRGRESLRRTLASLERQSAVPAVCVADNGSGDGSREMIAAEHPSARVLELGENRGFGAAVNAAARSSEARLICLLNNDAEADERFCEELAGAAARSGAAAVAGVLRLPDGTIDSAGVEADRSLVAYDHLHGEPYPPPAGARDPLGPCGGAAGFDREAFLALGGFDEGFFAYLEDLDLAIRMRLAGIACVLAPAAFAWHRHAGTLGAGSAGKNRLLGRGRGRLLWKHGAGLGTRARARGLAVDGVTYAGQLVLDRNAAAIRGRVEERRAHRGERRPEGAELARLPLLELGAAESLRRRWSRGRRYRGSP
jgi:N-acetylglucosaminyl-diphospho-decaprenol L-rhamnosyltransferase